MPLYRARSIDHPEIVIEFAPMTWIEFQEFLKEHPGYESVLSAPGFVKVN